MKGFKEYFKSIEEKAKQMSDKQFDRYFKQLLKKYKVKDIEELSDKDRKKFFKEIDDNVKADDE